MIPVVSSDLLLKFRKHFCFPPWISARWQTDWFPWEFCSWEFFPYDKDSCGTGERKFRKDKICSRSLALQLEQESRTEENNEHAQGNDRQVGPLRTPTCPMQKGGNCSSTAFCALLYKCFSSGTNLGDAS